MDAHKDEISFAAKEESPIFILCKPKRMVYFIKLIGLVAVLAVLLFYALPKVFGALWFFKPHEDRIHDPNYRAPLRVEYLHGAITHI